MQIQAWSNFRKKVNSTLTPNQEDRILIDGYMRNSDPFSIFNPVIRFSDTSPGFNNSVPPYKYFFITEFGNRYYYVVDWVHTRGVWSAYLREDVLASEKLNLGLHSDYVLRSSAVSNTFVMDTKYPTLSKVETATNAISSVKVTHMGNSYTENSMFNKNLESGTFVLGVAGDNSLAGVTYYAMSNIEFRRVVKFLFDYTPEDIGEVLGIVARAVLKPIQWITSIYWIPIRFDDLWTAEMYDNVNFGYIQMNYIKGKILDPVNTIRCEASFDITRHPQYSTRGRYLNSSAYTSYMLDFQPFGTFEISPDMFVDDSNNKVTARWTIDVATGEAFLRLFAGGTLISATSTNFGIPLRLTESDVDVIGTASALMSNIGSLMAKSGSSESHSNTITHNDIYKTNDNQSQSMAATPVSSMAQNNSSMATSTDKSVKETESTTTSETYKNPGASIGGIVSALPHALQMPQSIGGAASFNSFSLNTPTIYSRFSILVNEDNDNLGRPLCEVVMFSSIPGFIQCEQGHFRASTLRETDEINKYLVGGFFYE